MLLNVAKQRSRSNTYYEANKEAKKSLCRNIVSTIGAGKEGIRKSKMEGILVSKKMTLKDIIACNEDFLYPNEVASILNKDPQGIRVQAHQDASKLGFPVCICKSRILIPRLAFLKWCGVDMQNIGKHDDLAG